MIELLGAWKDRRARGAALCLFTLFACALAHSSIGAEAKTRKTFFNATNVHTIQLTFTAEQWEGIEPKRTSPPRFGFGGGEGMNLSPEGAKRNGVSAMMGLDFGWVHADADIDGEKLHDVAVRYKGNGTYVFSQGNDKRPLKLDFNRYVKGQKFARLSKLNLANNTADHSYMNDNLSYEVFRAGGVPAPKTSYARVLLTVPGKFDHKFLGLYTVIEDVDSNFTREHFKTRDGLLLKPSLPQLFDYFGDDWKAYVQKYDAKREPHKTESDRVIALARLVSKASDNEFQEQIGDYINLDEFARFMAVTVYLSNLDGILAVGQNYYLFLDPNTLKFTFIPWDLDHSWGGFNLIGTQEARNNLSINHPYAEPNRFLERMLAFEQFKKLYLGYLSQFRGTIFEPQKIAARVDQVAVAIRPAVKEESAEQLEDFDKAISTTAVAGDAPGPFGGRGPGFRFGGREPFINQIKLFTQARYVSVGDQLAGKSQGETIQRFGPGGRGGGGFGPAMFLAPRFLEGDTDKDGNLSQSEFHSLGENWFAKLDTDKKGILSEEQFRGRLSTIFPPPPFAGGPAGPPGNPPPNREGPGGPRFGPPGGFNPQNFLSGVFLNAVDSDHNKEISRQEFIETFDRWHKSWDSNHDAKLSDEELRKGINQDLSFFRGGPGGPGGFGPPRSGGENGGPPR
jgi:spore coat protein H